MVLSYFHIHDKYCELTINSQKRSANLIDYINEYFLKN